MGSEMCIRDRCTATRGEIPVIIGHRPLFTNNDQLFSCRCGEWCRAEFTVCQCCPKTTRQSSSRRSALRAVPLCRQVQLQGAVNSSRDPDEPSLSLYVLNAAALSMPHAIEMLTTDLNNHCPDVAIVTETHFKTKHTAGSTRIPGYCTFMPMTHTPETGASFLAPVSGACVIGIRKDRRGRKAAATCVQP